MMISGGQKLKALNIRNGIIVAQYLYSILGSSLQHCMNIQLCKIPSYFQTLKHPGVRQLIHCNVLAIPSL